MVIKKQDRSGNYTGEIKEYKLPKTVYDSKVISDKDMYEMGEKAAKNGYSNAIKNGDDIYNASNNGIDFRVYLDRTTKEIKKFHPK